MAKIRQLVVMPQGGGSETLGTRREVLRALEPYNTAPDGAPRGETFAYGPGFTVQFPMSGDERDELKQFLISISESDAAWSVLKRMRRELPWRMLDPDSGRSFEVDED